jgi:hypothetical protein
LLWDRRVGVFLVRATSRFFLALLAQILISLLIAGDDSLEKLIFSTSIFLVSFLLSQSFEGVLWNLFNSRHLYDRSYSNEMMRGYVAETTTPILLFGTLLVLDSVAGKNLFLVSIATIVWLTVTAFVYTPTFIALGVFQVAFFALEGMWLESILSLATLLVFGLFTISLLRRDKMSAGLIYKPTLNNVSLKKALIPALLSNRLEIVLMSIILLLCLFSDEATWYQREYGSLFFAISIPIGFAFLGTGHTARVWVRGWAPVFSLVSLVLLINMTFPQASWQQMSFFGLILLLIFGALVLFYYHKQQNFLLSNNYMQVSSEDRELVRILSSKDGPALTDSITAALWIDLYTDSSSMLSNYSTQNENYEVHLRNFVGCLKACSWSEDEVVRALTTNVEYKDWVRFRPISQNLALRQAAYFHTLQYFATNREYNQDLIADGMFDPKWGWSLKYKSMLRIQYRLA